MVENDASDLQSTKRLVSLFRSKDLDQNAINILNKFIEFNQDDTESWIELADIYLSKQLYSKAAYCYEEILLNQPKNYLVNLRYAEVLYSMAKEDYD